MHKTEAKRKSFYQRYNSIGTTENSVYDERLRILDKVILFRGDINSYSNSSSTLRFQDINWVTFNYQRNLVKFSASNMPQKKCNELQLLEEGLLLR